MADGELVEGGKGQVEGLLEDGRLAPEHPPLAHPSFAPGLKKIFAFAKGLEMEDRGLSVYGYDYVYERLDQFV